jgi:hypothetical protein
MIRNVRIGANRGKARLWLEGAWLAQFGFTKGAAFYIAVSDGPTLTITLGASEEHRARRVSGKGDRPIIDIAGDVLAPLDGKDLELHASAGRMIVKERQAQ